MQLLERRRGASIADITENMECLCPFLSTVGGKLDTPRAKVGKKHHCNKLYQECMKTSYTPDCTVSTACRLSTSYEYPVYSTIIVEVRLLLKQQLGIGGIKSSLLSKKLL